MELLWKSHGILFYTFHGNPDHSLYKSWPWVDLDLFYGKVNVGNMGFSMEKRKTLNFSGGFVVCDLKVGTYIQLIELMKSYKYSRSRSSLDIGQRSFTGHLRYLELVLS